MKKITSFVLAVSATGNIIESTSGGTPWTVSVNWRKI